MVVAFVVIGTFAVIACMGPARADATADALAAALAAEARHDYATELKLLRPLAERGNALAQLRLGTMYFSGPLVQGVGIRRDYAEAARWFRKAAEQGNALAQIGLGLLYAKGEGVSQNYAEAFRWFRNAAEQGHAVAQGALGAMYAAGQGVPRDYVQAYMWLNLAAAGGNTEAAQNRQRLEHLMTAEQVAEAQQLTAAWKPARSGEQPPAAPPLARTKQATPPGQLGTGFFIGEEGVIITNAHVVKGCLEARIGLPGRRVTSRVIARDGENDLALLRTAAHPPAVAALRLSARQGEAVAAYGYPLPGLLASDGNLTTGNITALSGIGDDSRLLQISTPVQPGNSGGPLLDGSGNVVGIVEGKLNAIKVATAIGDVPQNVNFAIKAAVMATFLDGNGVHYATGEPGAARSPADIAEEARRFTVPVECGGSAQ